jgi:D-inositol-3-phosphate glycosyltransferase
MVPRPLDEMGMSPSVPRPVIAVVVPSLGDGGGVPSVAEFIVRTIERSDAFEARLISLAMSSEDDVSLALLRPRSWMKGAGSRRGTWRNRAYIHVGAFASEFEFQRFGRRRALTAALNGCDLIQVVCGSPAWANAVMGLGKPVSVQVATRAKVERRLRDGRPNGLIGWWRRAMTLVTDRLDDRAVRLADAIQVENLWMLKHSQRLTQGNDGIDIRYAPPGVNARVFTPLTDRPLLSACPYILCVGRLDDPRKNIQLLLEAFARLPASLAHVHLVTAGAGCPPPDYWERVRATGVQKRVRHVHRPETADLVKLYQQAAAFALASDEEGLGVVILEAMACGVPVVATRCGGPDGILTEGQDGFLVPLNDAGAMADRLGSLCADVELNRRMGQAARRTIEARYAEEIAGQAFIDIWERLLAREGPR